MIHQVLLSVYHEYNFSKKYVYLAKNKTVLAKESLSFI